MQAKKPTKITIAGKINDYNFQICKTAALYLDRTLEPGIVEVTILEFFETQWEQYMKILKREKKGKFYIHKGSYIIFINDDEYIGLADAFKQWSLINYRYTDLSRIQVYKTRALLAMKKAINETPGSKFVFMDVRIGEDIYQKVIFELFESLSPKTCENFRRLCAGNYTNKQGEKIGYRYNWIHRVYKGAFAQGGDMKGKEGSKSVFDGEFPDESFDLKHDKEGLLGMCKSEGRKHSNECQFYVTLSAPLTYLDGKYCVFGRVISGMRVFRTMERISTPQQNTDEKIQIIDCGEYSVK